MTTINIFRTSRELVSYAPGEIVFKQGDPDDVMYAVVEGAIELALDGNVIESVDEGGILGELALVDEHTRGAMASASAAGAAKLAKFDKQHFTYLVQEHPTFALQVMKIMAERIRNANEH